MLTDITKFNPDKDLVFGPIRNITGKNGSLSYKVVPLLTKDNQRIYIKTPKDVFTYGLQFPMNADEAKKKLGNCSMCLVLDSDPITPEETKWIEQMNKFSSTCIDHLIKHKKDYSLVKCSTNKEDSFFDSIRMIKKYHKKNTDLVKAKINCKVLGYEDRIDTVFTDQYGSPLDPNDLVDKRGNVTCVLNIDSIFISTQITTLRVKLYQVKMTIMENKKIDFLEDTYEKPKDTDTDEEEGEDLMSD